MEEDLFGDGRPENSDIFSSTSPQLVHTSQHLEISSNPQEDESTSNQHSNQHNSEQVSGGVKEDGCKDPSEGTSEEQSKEFEAVVTEKVDKLIGIDLGTTFSCVAVWENGRPVVVANNMGNRTTPSWVCFHKDGTLVGEAARSKGSRFPTLAIYDAKRMIGRKVRNNCL